MLRVHFNNGETAVINATFETIEAAAKAGYDSMCDGKIMFGLAEVIYFEKIEEAENERVN